MRQRLRCLATLLSLVLLGAAVAACDVGQPAVITVTATAAKPTASPTATATPVPSASVVRVTNAHHFADSKSGGTSAPCANGDPLINGDCGVTVSATCANGDVVVSGGYTVDDPLAFVTSSFPSSAGAWTITTHDEGQDGGSHPVTVTAYADCLHANFAAGVSVASATPVLQHDGLYHDKSVACPQGTVLTGGGFRASGTTKSIPSGNGWTVALAATQGSPAQPKLFALCAAHHLTASATAKKSANPILGQGADLTVSCPGGTLLVGGGADTIGFGNITTLAPDGGMSQWQEHVSANGVVGGPVSTYTINDYAICVKVA